jgi:hypothetical protein
MPHDAIKRGRDELQLGIFLPAEMKPHLAQSEEIEMINEERGGEDNRPACGLERI